MWKCCEGSITENGAIVVEYLDDPYRIFELKNMLIIY